MCDNKRAFIRCGGDLLVCVYMCVYVCVCVRVYVYVYVCVCCGTINHSYLWTITRKRKRKHHNNAHHLIRESFLLVGLHVGHERRELDVLVVAQHVDGVLAGLRRVVGDVAAAVLHVQALDAGLAGSLDREAELADLVSGGLDHEFGRVSDGAAVEAWSVGADLLGTCRLSDGNLRRRKRDLFLQCSRGAT